MNSTTGPSLQVPLLPSLQVLGQIGAFTIGAGGLLTDELSLRTRWILVCGAGAFIAMGFVASLVLNKRAAGLRVEKDRISIELEQLKGQFDPLQAEGLLRSIAQPLFEEDGGWRLSVYVLRMHQSDAWMCLVGRVSSYPPWETSGRESFRAAESFFRELHTADLTSTGTPYVGESGGLPDPAVDLHGWRALQLEVLQRPDIVDALHMRPRKYAWCAAREADGERRVVALMAESVLASGISVNLLRSRFTPALLSMIARAAEAQSSLAQAVDERARALGVNPPDPGAKVGK